MEEEMTKPGRGSPESAAWFRAKLDRLGMSQPALARLMLARGDDRQKATILRCLSRMATGEARVSGEMRALLGTLEVSRHGEMAEAEASLAFLPTSIAEPREGAAAPAGSGTRTD